MKPIKRKLSLNTQTLRNLSADKLGRVVGGLSSARGGLCSTYEDGGCYYTGPERCTNGGSCNCPEPE